MTVLIAGGGIGGLVTALTLHQIGLPCRVFESVRQLRPLGVGLNLQPNAVRELFDLGLTAADLDTVGIQAKEWALVGLNGNEIYAEPRGLAAGYNWPQYAVHRGALHMLLYRKVVERLGAEAVVLGHEAKGYSLAPDGGVELEVWDRNSNQTRRESGRLLIGADGIHSAIRAQMHPTQPPIHWGGIVMWRGVTRAKAIRTGSSFVGLGRARRRLVLYPISEPDAQGLSLINWIAEITYDDSHNWQKTGYYSETPIEDFAPLFDDMVYDWLDFPAMLRDSEVAYENPMIDRDPIAPWNDGPVLLLGDAAHPMFPTGSNGASQAIIDARKLGAALLKHGPNPSALAAVSDALCAPIGQLQLRNRGDGPFGLLAMVDARCEGVFDNIDDVIPPQERADFMQTYKEAAGFARDAVNQSPPLIGPA